MLGTFKTISLALAINIIAGGTFAFAQNTIAESTATYKNNTVPGYDVTGIIFDVDDADPSFVDAIIFNVAPSIGSTKANRVEIQTEKDGPWTECSLAGRVATCTFASLAAEDVTALDIVVK